MAQLSKEDDKVVRKWWKCSSEKIFESGRFILDNEYRPSASTNCCKLVGNGKSFQSILRSAGMGNIVRRSPFFDSSCSMVVAVSKCHFRQRRVSCSAHSMGESANRDKSRKFRRELPWVLYGLGHSSRSTCTWAISPAMGVAAAAPAIVSLAELIVVGKGLSRFQTTVLLVY
jgi:hypothetical protein